nr:hypothetical protein [Tanacetum cinerariifolium]
MVDKNATGKKVTQLLIEVLQEMACDPSWNINNGFRSNYMAKVCQWNNVDKKITCEEIGILSIVRDRATGTVVEGFKDVIHNMENEQNGESGGDNEGGFHISLAMMKKLMCNICHKQLKQPQTLPI